MFVALAGIFISCFLIAAVFNGLKLLLRAVNESGNVKPTGFCPRCNTAKYTAFCTHCGSAVPPHTRG